MVQAGANWLAVALEQIDRMMVCCGVASAAYKTQINNKNDCCDDCDTTGRSANYSTHVGFTVRIFYQTV
jgi:hypothetical protein